MQNWFQFFADIFDLPDDDSIDTAFMDTAGTPLGGTGNELRYSPLYSVEEYINLYFSKIDARRFAIIPSGVLFTMHAVYEERATAFIGWFKSYKHGGRRRDPAAETYPPLMDMHFVWS